MTPAAEAPRSAPVSARRPGQLLWIALLLVAAGLLGRNVLILAERCHWSVRCPYETEYGEGVVLREAVVFAQGGDAYHDYRKYPFVVATYPPLYPLVSALGIRWFGVSLAFGRILSCLATIAVAVMVWIFVRRAVRSRIAPYAGALLFLAAPIVLWWAALMRADMPALAVGLAALYCVMRGGRWLIAAVLLLATAVYTKQSAVAPLLAAVGYLALTGRWRGAAFVGLGWTAIVLGVFAAMQVVTNGWFYRHLVVANMNLWTLEQLAYLWRATLACWPFPFVMGAAGAGIVLGGAVAAFGRRATHRQRTGDEPSLLLGLYFVCAMLVSLTAGKIGANINYMLEPLAAACIMSGVAYDRLEARLRTGWVAALGAALALAFIAAMLVPIIRPRPSFPSPAVSHRKIVTGGSAALAMIGATKGDILSEDTALPVLAGRELLLDPHKMTSMFLDGNWDQRTLLRDIQRKRFALIILRWDPIVGATDRWGTYGDYCWTTGMGRAIMSNYHLVKKAGRFFITIPADAEHPSCAVVRARPAQERKPQP